MQVSRILRCSCHSSRATTCSMVLTQHYTGLNPTAAPAETVYIFRGAYMSYGLNLGWGGPIGDYIGFWGGPIKGYPCLHALTNLCRALLIPVLSGRMLLSLRGQVILPAFLVVNLCHIPRPPRLCSSSVIVLTVSMTF